MPLRRLMQSLREKYGEEFLNIVKEDKLKLGLITKESAMLALERTRASETYDQKVYEK